MVKYRKIILPSGHTASVAGGNFTPSLVQRRSGAKLSNAPVEEKYPTVFNLVPKWFRYLKQCWGAWIAKSWSSLVVGDEGPSGKLLCLCETLKNYAAHAWHHWLLGRSSCSSPTTEELHGKVVFNQRYRASVGSSLSGGISPQHNINTLYLHDLMDTTICHFELLCFEQKNGK